MIKKIRVHLLTVYGLSVRTNRNKNPRESESLAQTSAVSLILEIGLLSRLMQNQ